MVFSSIYFVFVFLPLILLIYYLVPKPGKNIVLAAAGLIFYAFGKPENLIFLLFSFLFNYLTGLESASLRSRGSEKAAKGVLIAAAAADLLLLAVFKYLADSMPLGISFYTFTVLSYLFDLYQGRAEVQKNPLYFLIYVSFFPKVASGPIVQYADMEKELAERTAGKKEFYSGFSLFLTGLFKKALIADALGAAFAASGGQGQPTVLSAWLTMIFYSLQLYFDFSGYSDMAIGLAEMFGFHFDKNFDHPYLSSSVAEFWRRWHISLGNWFKQYVYFPMGGSRVGTGRIIFNTAVVWILTGIWHGNTLAFLIWGLYHGVFVLLDRYVLNRLLAGIPKVIRTILTVLVTFIGWVFFFSPTIGEAFSLIGRLFGAGAYGFADNMSLFLLRGNLLLLIIAAFGCTEIPSKLYSRFIYENRLGLAERTVTVLHTAVCVFLLISAVAAMLAGTYSSFLYFKF